jgi:hypothetical protein
MRRPITTRALDATPKEFAALAKDLLGRGHRIQFRAHGLSMTPFIRDGDMLTVSRASMEDLKAGEVAFYLGESGRPTAHRVLGIGGQSGGRFFFARGDASGGRRETVPDNRLLGKVVGIRRRGALVRLDRNLPRRIGLAWADYRTGRAKLRQCLRRLIRSLPGGATTRGRRGT